MSGKPEVNERERPALAWMEWARLRVAQAGAQAEAALFPFAILENGNTRDRKAAQKAFESNQRNRGLILPYLGAWTLRSCAMGAALSVSSNAQAAGLETLGLQVAFALAFCLSCVACVVLAVGWTALGGFES